jgi:predicted RNA-binding protein with PIN domain
MRILIDGYNLLFQSGLGGRARGPGWIQQARGQLINFLHAHMGDHWTTSTTIVFDKSQGKETQLDYHTQRGMRIVFAIEHPEADDLIEELIQAHTSPKSLMVVSSDLRVRRRAVTRRARSVDSEAFLRMLEGGQFLEPPTGQEAFKGDSIDEADRLSDSEVQFWLREFGDL